MNEEKYKSSSSVETIENLGVETLEPSAIIDTLDAPVVSASVPVPEATEKIKKKKFPMKLVLIILLIMVLLGGGFVGYQYFMGNPYTIYKMVVTNLFAGVKEDISSSADWTKNYVETGNFLFDTNVSGLEELNNYIFDYKIGINAQNNQVEFSAGLNESEKNILNVFLYLIEDKLYFESEEIYDKLIYLDDFEINVMESILSKNDILYVYNKLEQATKYLFTKEDFKTKNTTVNVNGKKFSVKDNYVEITDQNIAQMVERFFNTFKNDSKFLEIICKIMEISTDDLVQYIDEIIAMDYSMGEEKIVISIYTKPLINTVVGGCIKYNDEEFFHSAFDGSKGEVLITFDSLLLAFDVNKDTWLYTLAYDGQEVLNGKLVFADNEFKFNINVMDVAVDLAWKKANLDGKITNNAELTIIYESQKMTIKYNNEISQDNQFSTIETNGAKDYQQISEKDLLKNLQKALKGTMFYEYLSYIEPIPDSACENANCECDGDVCECTYYDNSFNLHTITCPNPEY